MASVFVTTIPLSEIEYSISDGHVRECILYGDTLWSESRGIDVDSWKEKLVDFVLKQRLHIDHDGMGLPAFIYRMIDEGLIKVGA